jgi:hypothetical protein
LKDENLAPTVGDLRVESGEFPLYKLLTLGHRGSDAIDASASERFGKSF